MSRAVTPPLVGLSTYREDASWGVWRQQADLLHAEYADAVVAAGGVPVLLPPAVPDRQPALGEAAAAVVARIDALVITGGADLDPERYGEGPGPHTANTRPGRDAWELALVGAADEISLPLLGICRGMQLMAVAAGGVLDQHTPDLVGDERHSPGADRFGEIGARTAAGSVVRRVVGELPTTYCHHHQSVRTHPGYHPTAWAEDGVVEAIEGDAPGRFRVAVQWHPEMRRDARLFAALVEAARERRAGA